MLRNLEQINSALEPALPGQRTGNVRKPDRTYAGYDNLTVTDSIAAPYLYVAALPDSYRARNLASEDSLAQLLCKYHVSDQFVDSIFAINDKGEGRRLGPAPILATGRHALCACAVRGVGRGGAKRRRSEQSARRRHCDR